MDWIIMIFNLYSYYLISNKKTVGFLLALVASLFGIIYFIGMSVPMVIMYIAFSILNLRGYLLWKKESKV